MKSFQTNVTESMKNIELHFAEKMKKRHEEMMKQYTWATLPAQFR